MVLLPGCVRAQNDNSFSAGFTGFAKLVYLESFCEKEDCVPVVDCTSRHLCRPDHVEQHQYRHSSLSAGIPISFYSGRRAPRSLIEVALSEDNYLNQLAWSHPHYYYLSDSNVEWGEDTGELARYLRAHDETKVRAALLGGWITLARYGVEYVDATRGNQEISRTRYIAIGASFLNGSTVPESLTNSDGSSLTEEQRTNFFAVYRGRSPEAVFGNSIYLYREAD